ncbi:uncharacterized protein LOC132708683 isoform X2 [Cylas formicarius]|uniref:uncharacterized protein LOC132708683 isoform X2 n=1 Tax=Cylas formicarius TaxID=197179 RepID=UPI00295851A6|nr:uncharacterized protein LOC132708683 isoform X2 [Cylas formicarius]
MELKTHMVVFLVSILWDHKVECETSSSIPDGLQPCYRRNYTAGSSPPFTIPVLIELLRKIELDERYTINTRIFANSVLHRIVFDGIQRNPNLNVDDNFAVPYRATLNKFFKYKVVIDYLTNGRVSEFPLEVLPLDELCFLHKFTSNTIDRFERGDESDTCNDNSFMSMASDGSSKVRLSNCPLKLGNIKTKWGTVSASHLISGIASGLQQNEVTFQRVYAAISEHKGLQTAYNAYMVMDNEAAGNNVDNVLFTTMAGDLGEVVLNQAAKNFLIDAEGFWNDTLLPRAFYLKSTNEDLTRAEILGGIDGAILGKRVQYLLNILDSTRLSQVLDMYYSDRGIPYQFGYKVTTRSASLNYILDNFNLTQQIFGATQLLHAIRGTYEMSLTEDYIRKLSPLYAEQFRNISSIVANSYDATEYLSGKSLIADLEVLLILDGTFDAYRTQQMIYHLSEAVHVSSYGSRIGIINGQSGTWMVNVTGEIFQIFNRFNRLEAEGQWPVTLTLSRSLETIMSYYQNRTFIDCSSGPIKPMGQAILVFTSDGRLTDSDITRSEQAVTSIKSAYPHTSIVYVSQDSGGVLKQFIKDEEDFLIVPSVDVLSTVTLITEKLSTVPASIVKFYCNHSDVRFEDYLTPGLERVYEVHREYIRSGYITSKFVNNDYGEIDICNITSRTSPNNRACKTVPVNDEISFKSGDLCTPESPCDVQYSVTAKNSQIKCAENDCRYPDQVRVIITYTFSASVKTSFPLNQFGILLIIYMWLY